MGRTNNELLAFNRGIISKLALARVDTKRAAWSAELQTNWMPRTMGSMMLRPGLGYIGATYTNAAARMIPFVFSTSDKAMLEFTDSIMRVRVSDTLITRASVSAAVTNGNFTSNIANWTDNDEAGATSAYDASGYMSLTGDGTAAAIRDQLVTLGGGDSGVEHALRIVIVRGPVTLRVGTGTTDDSYINETQLETGTHSLAFSPTTDFNIRFMSRLKRAVLVDSCNIEAAGVMTLPTPYTAALLDYIRGGPDMSQSGDILYLACKTIQQRQIERRATRSWSIVLYKSPDGPYRAYNDGPITITPSALSGNITLTASADLFRSTHVGALFTITSQGQNVSQSASAQNTFSTAIRVTGVDAARIFGLSLSGLSGTGTTVTLQQSTTSSTGPWTDYSTYTADFSGSVDDGLDNQIIWYRVGVKTGGYSSGTIFMQMSYAAGFIRGVARVTAYTNRTVVSAEVLTEMGATTATDDWAEGRWSDYRGWPTAVSFHEGRLSWEGKDLFAASESDNFTGFNPDTEGDSACITRSIGSGPVDTINWAVSLSRLCLGGDSAEHIVKSSSQDEVITPSNCNIKARTTEGSAAVQALKVGESAVFVQRGGSRVYDLAIDQATYDFAATDLTVLAPEVLQPHVVRNAVQFQPDKRLHYVLSDGTAAVMVYDRAEKVVCWIKIETDGLIEDVAVLPQDAGVAEDSVYYVVKRTINGSTVRYVEKWALESECVGGTTNKQADAFITFTNSPARPTVTGLTHLAGEEVVVWADGVCPEDDDGNVQTYTVSAGGAIGLDRDVTTGIVGLAYTAQFKSAKLGQSLNTLKRIDHLGLTLAYCHARGIKFGRDFDNLYDLPLIYNGARQDPDTIYTQYDTVPESFEGTWDTDARLCLQAEAPRPVTVLASSVRGEQYA